MRFLQASAFVASALVLASCTEEPEGAPPSAAQAVSATKDGLTKLFRRECIEKMDYPWAREESKRIVATCGGILVGDGERGDCEQSVKGDVSWTVPTTTKSTVLISYFWGDDPRRLMCSVSTKSDLSPALEGAANSVASALGLTEQPANPSAPLLWTAGQDPKSPRLTFQRPPPDGKSPAGYGDVRFDTQGQWAGREEALERRHPAVLRLVPAT